MKKKKVVVMAEQPESHDKPSNESTNWKLFI
jgi:hypothetical protein